MQVPLLLHGCVEHSSMLTEQSLPVNPAAQRQDCPLGVAIHVPPLKQEIEQVASA